MGRLEVVRIRQQARLIADACHHCPHPGFARDVRAEGWDGGTDRRRNVASVCRLNAPDGSSGLSWEERLEVAESWHEAGRPDGGWPPGVHQLNQGSGKRDTRTMEQRFADIDRRRAARAAEGG